MKRSSQRRSILALAIGGLLFTSAACDNMQSEQRRADLKVAESLKKGTANRRNPTTQSLTSAINDLSAAAAQGAASPDSRIRANSALAQAEFEAGDRYARELASVSPEVNRTLWEMSRVAGQVQGYNDAIRAIEATKPDGTQKAIADKRAEQQAAAEQAKQKVGQLQGEIDKIKGQVAQLTQQKDAAVGEADAAADKAGKAEGKEAAGLLDQANEGRRKAGNLGHEIDKLSAALLPLERDLALEQVREKTATEAVAGLDEQRSTVEANWKARGDQIAQLKQQVAKLNEELTGLGSRLDELNKRSADLRAKAVDQFQKSAKHSATAANDARTLGTELGKWGNDQKFAQAPEKKAWDQLRSTFSPHLFKLSEAEADNAVANLHSSHAAQLEARQKVAKQVQDVQLTPPPGLTAGGGEDERTKVLAEANKAYEAAAEKFLGVYTGGTAKELKDVRDSARIARMFSLYGQYLNGDEGKLAEAKKEFQEAFGERKDDPFIKRLPAKLQG
jgi:chromosome segregation ATPase